MVSGASQKHVLILRVGQSRYGVPASSVREIVHMAALTLCPGQPSLLEGFLNVRGVAVPVIRLRQLFQAGSENFHMYTPLVILDSADLTAALEADAVEEVAEIDEASLRPLPEGHSANDCAPWAFTWNGEDIPLLSCDLLLLAKERECLGELQAAIQQRLDVLSSVAE